MRTLIVEDDADARLALTKLLEREGLEVVPAGSLAAARDALAAACPDLLLTDLRLPDGDGLALVQEATDIGCTNVVVVTGHASVNTAVEALRLGAGDYLTKPIDIGRLKAVVQNAKRQRALEAEVNDLRRDLSEFGRFGDLIGTSEAMQGVYQLTSRVAPTSANVFISGESGTGKEVLARTIHRMSKRASGPFLAVNCGAISAGLTESELFGHEKGSFTGAERRRLGYFERADRGTLFLDEITEMPIELQVKLLRVLETRQVERVGGDELIDVDVRVVAATNRPPEEAVAQEKLREDLFYRLKVVTIELPPLRERPGDAALLASFFLKEFNAENGTAKTLSRPVKEMLGRHSWPGNVRELRNVVEHAYIMSRERITRDCLPIDMQRTSLPGRLDGEAAAANATGDVVEVEVGLPLAEVERRMITTTLERFDGDKRKVASALGISLKTLYNRLNAYRDSAS